MKVQGSKGKTSLSLIHCSSRLSGNCQDARCLEANRSLSCLDEPRLLPPWLRLKGSSFCSKHRCYDSSTRYNVWTYFEYVCLVVFGLSQCCSAVKIASRCCVQSKTESLRRRERWTFGKATQQFLRTTRLRH